MHESAMADNSNSHLDLLGQLPFLNIYTQICFCFPVSGPSMYSSIIHKLTSGLERLSAGFPWLAGQVVNEGSGEGSSGIFKIKPLEIIPRLVVKDLRYDPSIPTMNVFRQAKFPISMLDEVIVAPRKTLPGSPEESTLDSTPVFLLQANFIIGGLLLTFVGQHSAMDMIGQGQIIHLFSKACRNEQFTSEELSTGNLDRRNIIPLLDDSYKQGPELARQILKSNPSQSTSDAHQKSPSLPPKCTWANFTFHSTSLRALKELATKGITDPEGFVSTDDALSAFIWQSVIRTRRHRLSPTTDSTFARAVNVRPYFNIPETYPGFLQNMTYHTYTVQKLVEEPLGSVASHLRSALDPRTSTLRYDTRALATFVSRTPDKSIISYGATFNPSSGIMLSSWAKLDCYELDFNLGLGKPEAVRRPRFEPFENLIYLMPRSLDGEIAVAICLRDEDLERLRVDEEFVKYGTYIG